MPIKKSIKRVIIKSPRSDLANVVEEAPVVEEVKAEEALDKPAKRGCIFCQKKTNPSYTDLTTLKRFMTDRAKILGRDRSGVCSKHQRALSKNIKYARHLSLLPFVPQV